MIALYLRLSMADGDLGKDGKEESNSIENQRVLLQNFVESRNDLIGEITEYVDDGYSGTNFDRPAFKQMLEDAKKGKIHTILVKDLSRLGRDYIGVGDYLEQIFPVLGIRLIAVNSMYDSNDYIGKTMGLEISISNLVNSLYSKDLSKKYRSAIRTKWKQGKSTAGRLPFGYKKDEADRSKWVIDREAADYVRIIFDKALLGWNTSRIADHMNEIGAPTPGRYKEEHLENYMQWNRQVRDEEWLWDTYKVWRILKCYAYTGALVQGTTSVIHVGSRSRRSVPKKDQVIIPDIHPAIVTAEEWEEAQAAIRTTAQYSMPQKTGFPLTGKIICGNCGLNMSYNDHGTPSICCNHRRSVGRHSKCDGTVYEAKHIVGTVSHALRTKLAMFQTLNEILQGDRENKGKADPEHNRMLERELENLKAKKIYLYESYAEGHIGKEEYLNKKQEMSEQIQDLEQKKSALSLAIKESNDLLTGVGQMAAQAEGITDDFAITVEMAETFIETVVIYDPKHIEVRLTFEDLLQEAVEKAGEILKQNENGEEIA